VSDGDLLPGSRSPESPHERDLLLRRVPEVALVPELRELRFTPERLLPFTGVHPATRIAELADAAYLERLRSALATLEERANEERNGGLRFLSASLRHFVTALPPERHPLIVALYFVSAFDAPEGALDEVARRMDEYENALAPLVVDKSLPPG